MNKLFMLNNLEGKLVKAKKRLGRGNGSHGSSCGRGKKGQKSFETINCVKSQFPTQYLFRKRGFIHKKNNPYAAISIDNIVINGFAEKIDPAAISRDWIVKKFKLESDEKIKIIGTPGDYSFVEEIQSQIQDLTSEDKEVYELEKQVFDFYKGIKSIEADYYSESNKKYNLKA